MKKLICIVLGLALIFSLTACGGPSPTDATKDFLEGIKKKDVELVKENYADGDFNLTKNVTSSGESEELDKVIEKELTPKLLDFEYEVTKEEVDGDKAKVDVKIKAYDVGEKFSSFIKKYITEVLSMAMDEENKSSEADIEKTGAEMLSKEMKDLKKDYEKTVTISLTKVDKKWKVDKLDDDGDVMNVLSGGIIEALKDME